MDNETSQSAPKEIVICLSEKMRRGIDDGSRVVLGILFYDVPSDNLGVCPMKNVGREETKAMMEKFGINVMDR